MEKEYRGTVSAVKAGFGFIKAPNIDELDKDSIYYNNADTTIKLHVGDQVKFTIGRNGQGPCARNVWRVKQAFKKKRPKSVTKTVTTTKRY